MSDKKFKILSIDGGGIRGIFPAMYLAQIEAKLKSQGKKDWQIYQNFNLICGTSTGGILAIALSLGIPAIELVNLYYDNANKIFGDKRSFFKQMRKSSYQTKALEKLIKDKFQEKNNGIDPILKDCKIPTCVTTYDMQEGVPSVLKSKYHDAFVRDYHIPAYIAALATSAAPTYFDPLFTSYKDSDKIEKPFHNKIDGGVFCNNPTLTAIIEAQEAFNIPLENLAVLSIGTGTQKFSDAGIVSKIGFFKRLYHKISSKKIDTQRRKWGIIYWMWNKGRKPLIDLFMQGQSQQVQNLISLMQKGIGGLVPERFVYQRINTELDENCKIDLDETDKFKLDKLREKAVREFQLNGHKTLTTFF